MTIRGALAVLLAPALVLSGSLSSATEAAGPAAAAAPVHSVTVTGDGVVTYPEFSDDITRYGITTTADTGGTVTVTASTSDPGGRVLVNGRPLTGGTGTVPGLVPGDEVAVFIEDSAGTARHSFIYLPAGFPVLEQTVPDVDTSRLQPGAVLLTLSQWVRPVPPDLDFFETAVDVHGVPLFARRTPRSVDLQRQPDGHLTVFRGPAVPTVEGEDLVVLDSRLEPVATRRTIGLRNTDFHDAVLEADGTLWLMAYEPRNPDGTGRVDAVIQRIEPDGTLGFEWTSAPYVDDAMRDVDDYAHVNSLQVMSDGDLLVSFRHFSSVFKIHPVAGPGVDTGEVVWKLGGRDSDFTFPPGDGGPCAQHTARELPNGNIQLFDNGSWSPTTAWCVDPANPAGPPVQRVQTRVVEFDLDEAAGTASVARSYAPPGWFAVFAGSSQPLPNGNTLIGWAEETNALTSEIDDQGELLWQLREPSQTFPYFSYRAHKTVVPDAFDPTVTVSVPAEGATYVEGQAVAPDFRCGDRGGSSLYACQGPPRLDTSTPGEHTATFTAVDGAGRSRTVTRSYVVRAATGVDVSARKAGGRRWADEQLRSRLTVPGDRATVRVRLRNDGAGPAVLAARLRVRGDGFRLVRPRSRDITTPLLAPGQAHTFRMTVVRRASARPGDRLLVTVTAETPAPVRSDRVRWRVRTG